MDRDPLSLPDYQALVARLVIERGFEEETVNEVFTGLVEELGELAKAIRISNGQKVDGASARPELADEAADVLWLLLDLSNRLGVDLERAFAAKEAKNRRRVWAPVSNQTE